ncbi:MAG: serine/threonine protein phosphatase, partial [Bacteroidales bacterium]|nr:serine/threonine protein phosphatase [Bacteroidales bacterium]
SNLSLFIVLLNIDMKSRIFAIGDIHGCFDSFHKLVEDKIKLTKTDTLILLGDYIDRGKQVKEVLDYIKKLQADCYDVIPLRGNHEVMLLNAYENNDQLLIWILNGGLATLNSFGINSLNEMDNLYMDFFKKLPFYYELENYYFVHAGFNDNMENPFEDKFHMIWICRETYNHPKFANKTIVHGHCIVPLSVLKKNIHNKKQVIGIDTGCVFSHKDEYGILSAIELTTMQIYYVYIRF